MVVLGKVRTRIEQSTDPWVAVVVGQQYNKKGSRRKGAAATERAVSWMGNARVSGCVAADRKREEGKEGGGGNQSILCCRPCDP